MIPHTYELANHVLTLGMDVRWRRAAARAAVRGDEKVCLDVCTGTGEMAFLLRRLVPSSCSVIGVDFSHRMLRQAIRARGGTPMAWTCAALPALPFPSGIADLATVSFATRNLRLSRESLAEAFAEIRRVLRPGGRLVVLETSQPRHRLVRQLFHLYVRLAVHPLGALVSGTSSPYAYLARTILRFPHASDLAAVMHDAGFGPIEFRLLLGGVVAVHLAHRGERGDAPDPEGSPATG
ncbi:MAG: ubiquinone/menaquinone biosynthesis methyltransferase [Candidatus Eisenbacteria bacterium]|nr:ubiquinone/menaquinone biosynthesis methyltransferase [Candidatus Eisenbacteria bacterium]